MVLLLTSLNPKHIFDEKILLESKTRYLPVPIKLVLQIARPFKKFSFVFSFVLLLVFLCSFQGTMERKALVEALMSFIIELNSPPGQVLNLLGGDSGNRTRDLLLAGQALSQLSYAPGLVLQEPRSGPED